MWTLLAAAALARPDLTAARAFLDWHCARPAPYAGALPLAPLAAAPPVDGGEEWVRHLGPSPPPLEIGSSGVSSPEGYEGIAVAADTPADAVARALAAAAAPLRSPELRWLLFRAADPPPPRPDPPLFGPERARFLELEASLLAGAPVEPYRPSAARCRAELPPIEDGARCTVAADRLLALWAEPSCRLDRAAALAWWSAVAGGGEEGVPVVLVPIRATGQDRVEGMGTWAEAAERVARLADLALSPIRESDREEYVPFEASELMVLRRGPPERDLPRGATEQRCVARVWIDRRGDPERVEVTGCEEAFGERTRAQLAEWRWYPPRIGPVEVKAVTTMVRTYAPLR